MKRTHMSDDERALLAEIIEEVTEWWETYRTRRHRGSGAFCVELDRGEISYSEYFGGGTQSLAVLRGKMADERMAERNDREEESK